MGSLRDSVFYGHYALMVLDARRRLPVAKAGELASLLGIVQRNEVSAVCKAIPFRGRFRQHISFIRASCEIVFEVHALQSAGQDARGYLGSEPHELILEI